MRASVFSFRSFFITSQKCITKTLLVSIPVNYGLNDLKNKKNKVLQTKSHFKYLSQFISVVHLIK